VEQVITSKKRASGLSGSRETVLVPCQLVLFRLTLTRGLTRGRLFFPRVAKFASKDKLCTLLVRRTEDFAKEIT